MTKYFEDHEIGSKQRFGSYRVEREDVLDFAAKFDPQPFHLDDKAAANSHFGRISASGWHSASILMRLHVDDSQKTGDSGAVIAGAGVEELRWLKPLYPDDIVYGERELLEKRESLTKQDRGIMKTRMTLYNQHDEVVMTMLCTSIVKRRPSGT